MPLSSRFVAVLLTALVVGSVAGAPLASQSATAVSAPPGVVPTDQKFDAAPNVDVWERSILTTRAEFTGAATEVPVGVLSARLDPVGSAPVRSDRVGVVDRTDAVTVTFDQARASSDRFAGQEAELVVARVERDGRVPTTFSELVDTLDTGTANQNATFVRETEFTFDGDGRQSFTFNAAGDRGPGQYVLFVAAHGPGEEGMRVQGGDLSVDSASTVVGVEQITVQRAGASVERRTETPAPGDDLTFSVDASGAFAGSGDVTHVVMVYDEETFTDPARSRFTLVVPESAVDDDLNLSEDSTLEHTIGRTVGVADVEDGARVNDVDLADGRVSRSVRLGSVVDFVAEELQGNPPQTRATGDTTLYASMTATANDGPTRTLTVETNDSWEPGTYRYVYLGTLGNNGSAVSTDTGTFAIGAPGTRDTSSNTDSETEGTVTTNFVPTVDGGNVIVGARISVRGVSAGRASVAELGTRPSTTPEVPGTFVTGAEIGVPGAVQGNGGQVRLTLDRGAVDGLGLAAADLRVYGYDAGTNAWTPLTTSVVSATAQEVTLAVEVTGFGLLAVGTAPGEATPTPPGDRATPPPTDSPTQGGTETTAPPSTSTETASPTPTAGGGPGFGAVVALVAVLGAALLLGRFD
jgi:PGF-CTERM protein